MGRSEGEERILSKGRGGKLARASYPSDHLRSSLSVTIRIYDVCIFNDMMASYLARYGSSEALNVAQEFDANVEKIMAAAA